MIVILYMELLHLSTIEDHPIGYVIHHHSINISLYLYTVIWRGGLKKESQTKNPRNP